MIVADSGEELVLAVAVVVSDGLESRNDIVWAVPFIASKNRPVYVSFGK
jgi:hypothetical protein